METVLLLAVAVASNIACFVIGAKVGQAVSKGEKVTIPDLNPLKAYREKEAKKVVKAEADKMSKILRNIERYDGTGRNQEDVN